MLPWDSKFDTEAILLVVSSTNLPLHLQVHNCWLAPQFILTSKSKNMSCVSNSLFSIYPSLTSMTSAFVSFKTLTKHTLFATNVFGMGETIFQMTPSKNMSWVINCHKMFCKNNFFYWKRGNDFPHLRTKVIFLYNKLIILTSNFTSLFLRMTRHYLSISYTNFCFL